jgi:hypothetical protein
VTGGRVAAEDVVKGLIEMKLSRIELLAIGAVALFVGALASLTFSSKPVSAHTADLQFKWFNNGYDYENIDISGISSSWNVSSGVWVWYWNTDLQVNYASGFLEIDYVEGNYGNTTWIGRAQVYSNSGTCMSGTISPPGACSKSYPDQATTAVILLNTNDSSSWALTNRPIAARHELGHVFGLKHYSESNGACENILMDNGSCDPHTASVTTHDSELVSNIYY